MEPCFAFHNCIKEALHKKYEKVHVFSVLKLASILFDEIVNLVVEYIYIYGQPEILLIQMKTIDDSHVIYRLRRCLWRQQSMV